MHVQEIIPVYISIIPIQPTYGPMSIHLGNITPEVTYGIYSYPSIREYNPKIENTLI